jgi:hypothetical protein
MPMFKCHRPFSTESGAGPHAVVKQMSSDD